MLEVDRSFAWVDYYVERIMLEPSVAGDYPEAIIAMLAMLVRCEAAGTSREVFC